ncbi:hypothetical protein [Rhodococcus qingshengii]|uniref:hypothetical protein n=1 Tax=Rhodococcus qingshengii TaxID=334542 RepID=UPI001BEB55D0|nr:hypothetical protein [Rhodococcus qingshengii]MBT2273447.1 hypothetical protein [Rhodococcus qingshengii]
MTDKNGKSKDVTAVGSRVRITLADSDAGGGVACTGVVIEDYEDMVIDRGSVGRDWAIGSQSPTPPSVHALR